MGEVAPFGDDDLDHVVVVTGSLADTVDLIESATGVRPAAGGRHIGNGSANALLALSNTAGSASYLEILGPDPHDLEPIPARTTFFGIDLGREPVAGRVHTWARRSKDLARDAERLRAAGIEVGEVRSLSRRTEDGLLLEWTLTHTRAMPMEGVFPFLIDWGSTPHPSASAPGVALTAFEAHVTDDDRAAALALGVPLPTGYGGPAPLSLTISGPLGSIAF